MMLKERENTPRRRRRPSTQRGLGEGGVGRRVIQPPVRFGCTGCPECDTDDLQTTRFGVLDPTQTWNGSSASLLQRRRRGPGSVPIHGGRGTAPRGGR